MPREWMYILFIVLSGGVFFTMSSPELAAHIGWLFLAFAALFLGYVISTGIKARNNVHKQGKDNDAISVHRIHISILTTAILLGVVGMEISVRRSGGLWGDPLMIAFHLTLVLLTVITFSLARFHSTGIKNPKKHKQIVYAFSVLFIATFTTGTILLFEEFSFFEIL